MSKIIFFSLLKSEQFSIRNRSLNDWDHFRWYCWVCVLEADLFMDDSNEIQGFYSRKRSIEKISRKNAKIWKVWNSCHFFLPNKSKILRKKIISTENLASKTFRSEKAKGRPPFWNFKMPLNSTMFFQEFQNHFQNLSFQKLANIRNYTCTKPTYAQTDCDDDDWPSTTWFFPRIFHIFIQHPRQLKFDLLIEYTHTLRRKDWFFWAKSMTSRVCKKKYCYCGN